MKLFPNRNAIKYGNEAAFGQVELPGTRLEVGNTTLLIKRQKLVYVRLRMLWSTRFIQLQLRRHGPPSRGSLAGSILILKRDLVCNRVKWEIALWMQKSMAAESDAKC
jgi:hypothetical protein